MPTSAEMKNIADDYGYALAFLKSDKELYKVFTKAVDGGWDSTRFVAAVRNTKWYKTHSETYRKNAQLKAADPETFRNQRNAARAAALQIAKGMGVVISTNLLNRFADEAFMAGYSEDQLRESIAGRFKQGLSGKGISGEVENAIRQTAYRNGVNVSDKFIQDWAKRVSLGWGTVEDAQQQIRENYAKTLAPGFAKELAAGQDLYDLASPYMQTMSKTLELNPADIDLFDPTIRKALASSSDKDGQPGSVPLWQFERDLKKDKRWLSTNGARDQVDAAVRNLSQQFGMGV